MNTSLLERLRGFQIPQPAPVIAGNYLVARLRGVDFQGVINSPDFGFERPYDAAFNKLILRSAIHLLGGDAYGRYAFAELLEFSLLLDRRGLADHWPDVTELQSYLVALASAKMSLQLEDDVVFSIKLYSFPNHELAVAYFVWRQQEAELEAIDRFCTHVLSGDDREPQDVKLILDGLAANEKEEILRQHGIEYAALPSWQRYGAGAFLAEDDKQVTVESELPRGDEYVPYLERYLY